MIPYVLTKAAEADLREIIRHSQKQWGNRKTEQYMKQVITCVRRLAEKPEAHQSVEILYPGLRLARCRHHYAFCLPQKSAPHLIVAILHERMDLIERLGNRLPQHA